MTPYHKGPPFPVSSSPIFPLNVQPSIRSTRPSPLSPFPLSDNPQGFSTSSGVLTAENPHGFACHAVRPVPSDWTGNDQAIGIDSSALGSQYRRTINDSPYPPSRSLASAPSGWDGPMNVTSYPPFPQGSDGATTFFYRSPTPSSRQRTNQACEKCRDRKTKCSGGRPTCTRCHTRGLVCEYATQHRVRGPAGSRRRNIPPVDPPTSPPSRGAFAPHPYAPPVPTGHPRWESQSVSPKGRGMEANPAARTSWPMSDHSDESSDSSGAASFKLPERTRYLGWSNAQAVVDGVSQPPRQGSNPIQYPNTRLHSMHHSAVDIKNQNQFCSPTLRPSPSMPQITSHATFSGVSYSVPAALDPPFTEFLSPSQESLRRCPSSSSSRASHSHSSVDEEQALSSGFSSDTMMLVNWLSSGSDAEDRRDLWRAEDTLPVVASAVDAEGETPKHLSQTFNVSEWVTGTDYCSSQVYTTSPATETVTPES